jgi:alpha-L-fucosidase
MEPSPAPRQLAWHELEFTAFLHFTINTFTNKEWGYGDEDPNLFNPEKFDADAIVGALADAGMRGRDPHLQASRWLLPVAHETTDHSVFHSAGAAVRATWCAISRKPLPAAR